MSGDVEVNPGPPPSDSTQLANILAAVQRIETGQTDLIAKVTSLQNEQKAIQADVRELAHRITVLESDIAPLKKASEIGPGNAVPIEVMNIQARCNDVENRLRRSNLLFLGVTDSASESWKQSEEAVIKFCANQLDIQLDPSYLERSHRIGKFTEGKNRPIIVKFLRYKDKENILSSGRKLKGTSFAVREDFSASVRLARRKLFEFASARNVPFKIRFDKLHINNQQFFFDHVSGTVERVPS